MAAFEALSEHKVLSGNATKLLVDGDATFSEILSVIDAAKDYVLVQFYTIRDDVLLVVVVTLGHRKDVYSPRN